MGLSSSPSTSVNYEGMGYYVVGWNERRKIVKGKTDYLGKNSPLQSNGHNLSIIFKKNNFLLNK